MQNKVFDSFQNGDLQQFEKLLSDLPNKGQVMQSGPNPIPCQAAAKGLTEFLRGDVSIENRKELFVVTVLLQ